MNVNDSHLLPVALVMIWKPAIQILFQLKRTNSDMCIFCDNTCAFPSAQ